MTDTSKKPSVLFVFGTRPEAIKLAPVIRAFRGRAGWDARVCVTAQHRQMLDQMLADFELTPDYDLDLMRPDQDLNAFCSLALPRLQEILRRARPDFVLVQGDTTTAMITALAAFYEKIPVGHVEAGLRSFDPSNPYPEEVNRLLIARLSALHFAPTKIARGNLVAEGVRPESVHQTGNTVVDSLFWTAARPHEFRDLSLRSAASTLQAGGDQAVLVTTHRRESFGAPLERLCAAFRTLVDRHQRLHLFYPVHMNPNVRGTIYRLLSHPRIHLLPTLGYFDLVHLLVRCDFVMTDSGGLQEEAPSLGKPVVVLREVTERPEAIEAGVAVLAGTKPGVVADLGSRLLQDKAFYDSMARKVEIFGDGRAGERIAETITKMKHEDDRPSVDPGTASAYNCAR